MKTKQQSVCKRKGGARGAVALIVALTITLLLAICALVVDIGNVYRVRSELQNTADSAALAAAGKLDGTLDGIDNAVIAAKDLASDHLANNSQVNVTDGDIVFGHWNTIDSTFEDLGTSPGSLDAPDVNAVKVLTQKSEERGDAVQYFVAPIIEQYQKDVKASAIAVGGGPVETCTFPLVVGECMLDAPMVNGDCEYCMVFHSDGYDTAGWTTFSDHGNVGNKEIGNVIEDACFENGNPLVDADGRCSGACNAVTAGQQIQVNNGNNLGIGTGQFCETIKDIINRDGEENPQSFLVNSPVIKTPGATSTNCDTAFKGKQVIGGYAVMEIFGVKCGNADTSPAMAPGAPTYCEDVTSSEKYIVAVLHCNMKPLGYGGGGFYGWDSKYLRLVR